MRTFVAVAMMCLLLLLSVGTARCEMRCAASAMPIPQSAGMGMSMADTGHCDGMAASSAQMAGAESACSSMMCRHAVLPAAPVAWVDVDRDVVAVQAVLPGSNQVSIMPLRRSLNRHVRPPLQPRAPLEQSSLLRV